MLHTNSNEMHADKEKQENTAQFNERSESQVESDDNFGNLESNYNSDGNYKNKNNRRNPYNSMKNNRYDSSQSRGSHSLINATQRYNRNRTNNRQQSQNNTYNRSYSHQQGDNNLNRFQSGNRDNRYANNNRQNYANQRNDANAQIKVGKESYSRQNNYRSNASNNHMKNYRKLYNPENNNQEKNNDRNRNNNDRRFQQYKHKNESRRDSRKSGMSPRPITLIKALHRLDLASPKILLQTIQSGVVAINGKTSVNPSELVHYHKDVVTLHGYEQSNKQKEIYAVMNKLRGTAGSKERKGRSIYHNFYQNYRWYFPIGCLDKSVGGIVILTNSSLHRDPSFSPFSALEKEYRCKIHRLLTSEEFDELQKFLGELLQEEAEVFVVRRNKHTMVISITVVETPPQLLRAALKRFDVEALSFDRYRVGSFTMEDLPAGAWRQLMPDEIQSLHEFAMLSHAKMNKTVKTDDQQKKHATSDMPNTTLKSKVQTLYRNIFKS